MVLFVVLLFIYFSIYSPIFRATQVLHLPEVELSPVTERGNEGDAVPFTAAIFEGGRESPAPASQPPIIDSTRSDRQQ